MKISLVLGVASVGLQSFCSYSDEMESRKSSGGKSIVVLYENDVHCGVEGYTKMAGLRNAINKSDTAQCIIVGSGDFIQGGTWGAISNGKYIIDLMNTMGYTASTIGNHEFDYGVNRFFELMKDCNVPTTCVNFSKYGSDVQYYKPYIMTEVSGKKIAFVGVVTPSTMESEYYSFYDKDHNLLYDLYPKDYLSMTQKAVDDAHNHGADYVILLSHLGELDNGFSSISMINNTKGIDLVLDGHTHSVIPDSSAVNKVGKTIHFTQTGTKFANIGKLIISTGGVMHTELLPINSVTYSDQYVAAVYDSLKTLVSAATGEKLGTCDHVLLATDASNREIVRLEETPIGNFFTDAFQYCSDADIALENGGGIRTDLPVGEITYSNMIDCDPYFDDLLVKEMTGSQIRELLAKSYSVLPEPDGGFLQVSGLKVAISINGGTPKLTDVQVKDKKSGKYMPLDDSMTYTVRSTDYVFNSYNTNLKDVTSVIIKDTECLKKYFVEALHGNIVGRYLAPEGRIAIK